MSKGLRSDIHFVISEKHLRHIRQWQKYFLLSFFWNKNTQYLPTTREGNVFIGVCQSFCSQLVSWLLGHSLSLLRRGQYTSYWNAFLFTNLTSSATANASTQWILKAVFHLMNKFLWRKFLSMFSIIFQDLPHIPYFCCITFTYIVLLRNFLLRYRTLQIIKTNKKI